jgi:hypothetical protein
MELLSGPEARLLPDGGCAILREVAENMLLCREGDREVVVELRRDAAATVGELTDTGLLSPTTGRELVALLLATGPPLPRAERVG